MEFSAAASQTCRSIQVTAHAGRWRYERRQRLKVEEAPTITKIPVLPISLCRRAAVARGVDRPRAPEDGAAALASPTTSAPAPQKFTSSEIGLVNQAYLRCDRKNSRRDVSR